ncbi:unnamed protein product, partial [Sphagnum tenellum]
MPLSIYASVIVINYYLPEFVALLKHPLKRHMLVKDLPPTLLAPLIAQRRYLQRILQVLNFLASLGLITYVQESVNQAQNRDIQSQKIYVHRQAFFYDTSVNDCTTWDDLKLNNDLFFADKQRDINNLKTSYDKCSYDFTSEEQIEAYWQKLLDVSVKTFKFNTSRYLHENKRLRATLSQKACVKRSLKTIEEPSPLRGDHMGPGGYDSQLFLNRFKNWTLSLIHTNASSSSHVKPVTKDSDMTVSPSTELVMHVPFGINPVQQQNAAAKYNQKRAQQLLRKAKRLPSTTAAANEAKFFDRRAVWHADEDELILLVKVAALFFFPHERSVPFQLITLVMRQLRPNTCLNKKQSAFGRRMKALLRVPANHTFIVNKLELCRQDVSLCDKYARLAVNLKRNIVDDEQVRLYVQFVREVSDKFKHGQRLLELDATFELPRTMDEFREKYKVKNQREMLLYKTLSQQFKQPTNEYEIAASTLHSAIH